MEDSVASAHRAIDGLLEKMRTALTGGDDPVAREAFAELRKALETHFDQEDHLYYPPIRALRPEFAHSVERFAKEHEVFRGDSAAIQGLLEKGSLREAQTRLERFRRAFAMHETAEEEMLHSLDREFESTGRPAS